MKSADWLIWQLADSGFPAGGFAHSSGLEAARHAGEVADGEALARFLEQALLQAGSAGLPLVCAAHGTPEDLIALDRRSDAFLSNHVANRASRTQGRAFLSTCERSFDVPALRKLALRAKSSECRRHHAPLFGAVLRTLGVELEPARRLYLFLVLRGSLSAAVRLSIVGPHQAQAIQAAAGRILDSVLEACGGLGPEDLAQTAPVLDILQGGHDRLYSRLFQS